MRWGVGRGVREGGLVSSRRAFWGLRFRVWGLGSQLVRERLTDAICRRACRQRLRHCAMAQVRRARRRKSGRRSGRCNSYNSGRRASAPCLRSCGLCRGPTPWYVSTVSTLSHIRTRTHKQRLGMCPLCVHTLTHTHTHARSTPWDVSALHTHTYAHARTITSTPIK